MDSRADTEILSGERGGGGELGVWENNRGAEGLTQYHLAVNLKILRGEGMTPEQYQ